MSARRRLLAGVALAAGIAGVAGGARAEGGLTVSSSDVSAYPTVTLEVVAPAGLQGLAGDADALSVVEGGAVRPATVTRVPTDSLEVVLVFDTSGSMEGSAMAAAKAAATSFLAVLPPEVRVGLVAFGDEPVLVAAPTTDRSAVASGIAGLNARGETALYDAVTFAVAQLSPTATDRAVVLLSDGGDTVSTGTLDQAVGAAGSVRLDAIELQSSEANRAALEQLAASGHGTVSSAADPAALTGLYQAVASTLVNRYRITYTSTGTGTTPVTVRLATPATVLEATTELALPAAPTVVPSAPAETVAPVTTQAAVQRSQEGTGSTTGWMLVGGAIAFFVGFTLLVLACLPGDRRSLRQGRRQLGLNGSGPTAVTQIGDRMSGAADQVLAKRGGRTIAAALEAAGIELRPGEFVVMVAGFALGAAALGFIALGGLGLVLALVAVPFVARAVLERKAERRRQLFADQLPETLQLLVSTLKSGYGLLQALDAVTLQSPQPMQAELRRVLLEIRVGRNPTEALAAVATRMRSVDFEWVVGGVDINREVGGDLAQILENVAETIRERQRLNGQIRTLTAEGRFSAYILIALPFFLAAVISVINPGYLSPLGQGIGPLLVGTGAVLIVIGWVWMRRLIKSVSL